MHVMSEVGVQPQQAIRMSKIQNKIKRTGDGLNLSDG